jgi:hypothetical protein
MTAPEPDPDGWTPEERRYTLMRLAFWRGLHGMTTAHPRS